MKKIFVGMFFLCMSLVAFASPWPSNALYQIKQSAAIQVDCSFLSAMLGKDMSNDYPQSLLLAYKNKYPDYSKFENYMNQYKNTADPIRLNLMKTSVRGCSFSSVWDILEGNSPIVGRIKQNDPTSYNRLRSITISMLQSTFGSIPQFVEQMCLYPTSATSRLERIVEEAVSELNSSSNAYSGTTGSYSGSQKITVTSNSIHTDAHIWRVISVEITNGKTIIYKQVTPKTSPTWISSHSGEFIEDAETGVKYYISSSSIGFNQKILYNTDSCLFSETYPQLPSSVRFINISSGSQYYLQNIKIR